MLTIREAQPSDLDALEELYRFHIEEAPPPPADGAALRRTFGRILADGNYHLLVGENDGAVVSSVTCVVVPNLTHGGRPWAVIENVVTRSGERGRGHASALMERACGIAREAGCYKAMLLTGSKKQSTLDFYARCGFSSDIKTGFARYFTD
jgi:GNAT superfamily N-acetyltransferase